jgi:chromosome segregation ATPase
MSDADVEKTLEESRDALVRRQERLEDLLHRADINKPPQTVDVADYHDYIGEVHSRLSSTKQKLESLEEQLDDPTKRREIYADLLMKTPTIIPVLRDAVKAHDHNGAENAGARPFDQVGPSGWRLAS